MGPGGLIVSKSTPQRRVTSWRFGPRAQQARDVSGFSMLRAKIPP